MEYRKTVVLKDGRECILRSGTAADAQAEVAITVNGSAHTNGQAATWETGDNVVRIVVTNGNATKAYTVTVTKSEEGNG